MDADMGQPAKTGRRAVNLSIDAGILSNAKALTPNLSATVERLLKTYIEEDASRKRAADESLALVLQALNAASAKSGRLSDDFPSV